MRITRALAVSTTLVVAALGTTAVAADAAVAGQHKGQAKHSVSQDQQGTTQRAAQGKALGKGKNHRGGNGKSHAGGNGKSHAGGNGKSHAGGNGKSHTGGNGNGGSGDPAGNNGTVKIAPLGEFDGIPNNTPHPGCDFLIEWYGFDEGPDILSTVTFAMQAPTSDVGLTVDGPSQVFVGGDPATGAGTDTGLDGRQQYTLSFDGAPQAQQGYHVSLTINTPDSQGADVKHKVFWVSDCESTATGTSADTSESDTQVAGEQATSSNSGADTSTGGTTSDTQVAGEQATAGNRAAAQEAAGKGANANLPTQVDAGGSALDWILSPVPLMLIALGAALLALGIVSRRRRA